MRIMNLHTSCQIKQSLMFIFPSLLHEIQPGKNTDSLSEPIHKSLTWKMQQLGVAGKGAWVLHGTSFQD